MVKITDLTDRKTDIAGSVSKAVNPMDLIAKGTSDIDTTLGKINSIFDKALMIIDKLKPVQQNQNKMINVSPVQQERAMQNQGGAPPAIKKTNEDLINQFATPEGIQTIDGILATVESMKGEGCTVKELRAELKQLGKMIGATDEKKTKK